MNASIALVVLIIACASSVSGQEIRRALSSQKGVRIPGAEHEEVQKAGEFSETELRVLRAALTLPVGRLEELLRVYERLDNAAMIDVLARAILRREPDNERALRIRNSADAGVEIRPPGYLDEIARQVLAGRMIEDTDAVALQANTLTATGDAAGAIRLLEALRMNQFQAGKFPYLDDLGYAFTEAGRFDEAVAAYEKVAADPRYSTDSRAEARSILPSLRLRSRIAALQRAADGDADRLLDVSAKLYREMPHEHEVIAFRIESLDRARRYDEAVRMLLEMKRRHEGGPWPYQPTLAYAFYGARRWPEAVAAFREIQKSDGFDPASRLEAETMILDIGVTRQIESGMDALRRVDMPAAEQTLRILGSDYPTHPDTLGYKAIYLAKTGRADEALHLLFARKREAALQGLPFSQQDALADVYIEQKDYRMATVATREILDHPFYDDDMKAAAELKLREIAIAQALEEGYRALQDGERARARRIVGRLRQMAPEDLEVRVFQAEVALAYHHAVEARSDLAALKARYPDQPFPGQEALAAAQFRTGDWEASFAAYAEILNRPGYEREDRFEAVWQRRALLPLLRPGLGIAASFIDEAEGQALQTEAAFTSGWLNDWRFSVVAHEDWTDLAADSYFTNTSANRFDAGVTAQRRFHGHYFAEASLGGYEEGMLFGARFGRFANQGMGWSLGFMGNQRSTESLNLQALDGREHRAEFRIGGPIGERWVMDFAAYHQWIHVGGDRLGDGFGFEGSLDYIIQTETHRRPEFSIGYFGEYHRFDSAGSLPPAIRREIRRAVLPQEQIRDALESDAEIRRALAGSFGNEIFDTLVDPETNRHGLRLTIRKRFDEVWAGYLQAGGYYAVDDKSWEYTAAGGLEYSLSDSAMLYAELRYDSNGRAASAGTGVWEANLGALVTF